MTILQYSNGSEELLAFADRFDRDPVSWAFSNAMTLAERKKIAEALRGAAQVVQVPTQHAIVEAFNDWSYYKKEGEPVGRMLAHEAAKVSFIAGAKWALALPSASGPAQAGRNAIIEECAQIADKLWAREVASQIRALTQPSTTLGGARE